MPRASDSASSVIGAFALMIKSRFILRYLQPSEMRKRVGRQTFITGGLLCLALQLAGAGKRV